MEYIHRGPLQNSKLDSEMQSRDKVFKIFCSVYCTICGIIFLSLLLPCLRAQDVTTTSSTTTTEMTRAPVGGGPGDRGNYTIPPPTSKKRRKLTTPYRISFKEDCDYLAYYCIKTYQTGELCGRTVYYTYQTFQNYCMLDYVNCMERYEVWQVVHMGECFNVTALTDYERYEYLGDYFLDQFYVIQD